MTTPLEGPRTVLNLEVGEGLSLVLRWGSGQLRYRSASPDELLRATLEAWRRWIRRFAYEGPQEPLVRRSAITLKLLDYVPTGAIVAAPTSGRSL